MDENPFPHLTKVFESMQEQGKEQAERTIKIELLVTPDELREIGDFLSKLRSATKNG